MAYTNPQQWLDLLRRRPGTRMTDLGTAGNVLDATGDFLNRQGADPRRDWRSMMAEGEARRQQSAAYGTPSAIMGTTPPGAQRPVNAAQSVANVLSGVPGSAVADPNEPVVNPGDVAQDPQGFFGKVGGFFRRPGTAELLLSTGGAMSQAASQPGASFLGSLGAGTQAGVAQLGQIRAQRLAEDKVRAEQAAAKTEAGTDADSLARRQAVVADLIADIPDLSQEDREKYMGYADSPQTLQMLEGLLNPDPTSQELDVEQFKWFSELSPEQQELFIRYKRNPPAQTNINTGDTVTQQSASEKAMGEWVTSLYDMRQTIETQTLPGLQNIDQTLAIVNDPRFAEISGVLRGNVAADVVTRVRGDAELLGMLGAFERLGQTRTLQILANFTGAKSNYELDMAQKMAQGDRSMTPDEMRDALELMRKAYVQDAVRWARDIQNLAPIEGEFADVNAGFRDRAQNILDQYDEEERGYYEFVDPLGIGRGPGD